MGATYFKFQSDRHLTMMTVIDYDAYWKTHPYIYEAVKEMDNRRGLPVPKGVAWGVTDGHWRILRPHVIEIKLTRTLTGAPPAVSHVLVMISEAAGSRIVGTITYKTVEDLVKAPREDAAGERQTLPLVLHRTPPLSPPDEAAFPSGT